MSDDSPSRALDKIIIRVPDGLRERIQRAAAKNGRSVNAELVTLLERTYPLPSKLDQHIKEIVDLIVKSPSDQRDYLWDSVAQKINAARFKPEE
ncbi:Arc family DNA-binding protein [Rhizobium lusitanum]|uniref:Arc family DNA-binding protein n=1 Tax=Rhizobium lusitanum TaxID=293958 RepID=UPI00195C079F|nr:Arc family DNA-binding protein [Rhizobium lusitanum]MBM7046624.1 Arc family DNA-binding protein [Rhizobium lusitanum]